MTIQQEAIDKAIRELTVIVHATGPQTALEMLSRMGWGKLKLYRTLYECRKQGVLIAVAHIHGRTRTTVWDIVPKTESEVWSRKSLIKGRLCSCPTPRPYT